MDEQDRNQDMNELVQFELADQKMQQEIPIEFVMNLLMGQNLKNKENESTRHELAEGSKNWNRRTRKNSL